jgi:hypothetical protein
MDMEERGPGQCQGTIKAENLYTFCDEQNFESERDEL